MIDRVGVVVELGVPNVELYRFGRWIDLHDPILSQDKSCGKDKSSGWVK